MGRTRRPDRNDQEGVRRRARLGLRRDLQEDACGLPDPPGAGGARALRLFRPPPGRQARRLPGRARLHAARLRPDADALDPLRRGEPGRPSRRALLRALGRRRSDRRPRPRPVERQLHHRRPAGPDRGGGLRPDAIPRRQLRPRADRCRAPLRSLDQPWALAAPNPFVLARPRRPDLPRRRDHGLADGDDLLGGPQGGPAHLRRGLHRDPIPSGELSRTSTTGSRTSSSSTAWR